MKKQWNIGIFHGYYLFVKNQPLALKLEKERLCTRI